MASHIMSHTKHDNCELENTIIIPFSLSGYFEAGNLLRDLAVYPIQIQIQKLSLLK